MDEELYSQYLRVLNQALQKRPRNEEVVLGPITVRKSLLIVAIAGTILSVFITFMSWLYSVPGNIVDFVAHLVMLGLFISSGVVSAMDWKRWKDKSANTVES